MNSIIEAQITYNIQAKIEQERRLLIFKAYIKNPVNIAIMVQQSEKQLSKGPLMI